VNALASFTASLIADIPVFIVFDYSMDNKISGHVQQKIPLHW
jgi:hypothetical protein